MPAAMERSPSTWMRSGYKDLPGDIQVQMEKTELLLKGTLAEDYRGVPGNEVAIAGIKIEGGEKVAKRSGRWVARHWR
jgi:hypothetical protein